MKKRKGDVALQQSIINIALMIVAALMILLAVMFVRGLFKQQSMGEKETFNNLVKQIQALDAKVTANLNDPDITDPAKKIGYGNVIFSLDVDTVLYGFSDHSAGVSQNSLWTRTGKFLGFIGGNNLIMSPAECTDSQGSQTALCLCECQNEHCEKGHLVTCKTDLGLQNVKYFAVDPTRDHSNFIGVRYDALPKDPVTGKDFYGDYLAMMGGVGWDALAKWGSATLFFKLDPATGILLVSDKNLNPSAAG